MSTTSKGRPPSTSADPWWGFEDPAPAADRTEPVSAAPPRAPRRRRDAGRRSVAGRIGWLVVGLLVAPIDLFRRLLARSPRLRRLAIRAVVVLAILAVLASSVGVILINNVVIGRTAELGELDERRRELRRENALLGAQAARLSSPDVVFRRASKELGMVPTQDVPKFIYLVRASHTLTPWQRDRIAEGGAGSARAGTAAAAPAASAKPATTETPAKSEAKAPSAKASTDPMATPVASTPKEDG